MKWRGVAVVLTIAAASVSALEAQTISTLEGVVRDETGHLARAQISAIDTLTGERRHAVTNEGGFFRIIDVTPGRYRVSAAFIGHAAVAQQIDVVVGERAYVELVLPTAPLILDQVVVESDRPGSAAIQHMSVSTQMLAEEIKRLPLNTRNVMDLAAVAPGIRSFQPVAGHALPAAGSLRDERAINLYIDGVEMKNLNSTNIVGSPANGSLIPVDALEEYHVLLNPYDAEYTRGAAYIISAVTLRGTNETHGSAFGFIQNRDFISVTSFQRGIANFAKPNVNRRQGGFSLRGPVVRDRLFYALSYEGSATHNYVAVVPGRPAADPTYWDGYAGVFDAPGRNHAALLHSTFIVNDANTLEAIGSSRRFTGESGFGGIQAQQSATAQNYTVNTINLRHRWLPASGLANELSFQFVGWTSADDPLVNGPTFNYPTLTIGRADATFEIHEKQLRVIDRLTYPIGNGPGSHLLKLGVEMSRVSADQFSPTSSQGVFRFRTETGSPDQATIGVGFFDPSSDRDALSSLSGWIAGGYVNDEWRVTPRLLFNLGVRYDAEIHTMNNDFTVPWASDTRINTRPELQGLLNRGNRKDDLDNFAPRASVSWDVTGKRHAFLRGGLGVMYDRIPGFVPFGEKQSASWHIYTFTNPTTVDPAELRNRVIAGSGTPVPPAIMLLPHRMDVPENRQWSLGFGVAVGRGLTLNTDYIDQRVRHLYAPVNLNWLDLSQTPAKRALSTAYGNITVWGDSARARYRGLLTTVAYRRDTTLSLTLAHTLASSTADWDVQTTALPAIAAKQYYVMQRTSGDERHRFVLSGGMAVGHGLALSTVATAASPQPYRTTVGQDVNRDNLLDDDWIDGKRYRVPPNVWKNWYRVVDVRVTKSIALARGARLSVIAEGFNIFNTDNYSGYFGVHRSATGELRPDFGTPSGIYATRQLQLGSSVEF
ncbi:MAG TPA: carboxypeptidase regulatory-like domain-containing protein [Gemmatimonadaceae bacterium]